MASLRRKPNSKYWIACFTLSNGTRAQRSTKTTVRKLAQKLADDYEAAARARMTEVQVRRVLSDLHKMNSGTNIGSATVRSYLVQWAQAKAGSISPATKAAYESTARDFCDFLADRADMQMLYVSKSDIAAFRDHIASSRASATANNRLKILRVAFKQAWRDGFIDDDPAAKVPILKAASEGVQTSKYSKNFTVELAETVAGTGNFIGCIAAPAFQDSSSENSVLTSYLPAHLADGDKITLSVGAASLSLTVKDTDPPPELVRLLRTPNRPTTKSRQRQPPPQYGTERNSFSVCRWDT